MTIIYSTFPTKKQAKDIGNRLLRKKLAGCINIFPIDSIYFCKGKIMEGKEFAVIIKTKKENFKNIEKFILEHSSYSTPCILEIPVARVSKKYAKWLGKSLKGFNPA